jgi:hypothetical protein
MSNLTTFQLAMQLEFGKCNNRMMEMRLLVNNTEISVQSDATGMANVDIGVDLPSQVVLQFTGKDPVTGTVTDDNGNIIEDMFVKILSIALDGFKLNEKFIHQKIKLVTDNNQEIITSYIGFNGTVTLDLAEFNVFSQYLSMKNL